MEKTQQYPAMTLPADWYRMLECLALDNDARVMSVLKRAAELARAVRLFDGVPMDTSDLPDAGHGRVGYYLRASSALEEAAEALLTAIELECGDDDDDLPF